MASPHHRLDTAAPEDEPWKAEGCGGGAAKILIYEPASQGASTHAQLTQDEIVDRVRGAKYDAEAIVDPEAALQRLNDMLQTDDVVLLLTSGELGGLSKSIPKLAEQAQVELAM